MSHLRNAVLCWTLHRTDRSGDFLASQFSSERVSNDDDNVSDDNDYEIR